jgi:hypothetical protein
VSWREPFGPPVVTPGYALLAFFADLEEAVIQRTETGQIRRGKVYEQTLGGTGSAGVRKADTAGTYWMGRSVDAERDDYPYILRDVAEFRRFGRLENRDARFGSSTAAWLRRWYGKLPDGVAEQADLPEWDIRVCDFGGADIHLVLRPLG